MRSQTRRTLGTLGLLVGTATLLGGLVPANATAASVEPTQPDFQGNMTCAQLNPAASDEFKLEGADLSNGTHTQGLLEVTISNLEEHSFDWKSNFAVSSVFVKAGSGGNLYTYDPPAFADTNLVPPGQQAISHISFCMVAGTTPSSSTSSTTATTSTTQVTTTTTVPTTTTTQATTTTTAPTTTTTAQATTTTQPTTTTTTEGTTTTTEGTTTTAPTTSTTEGTTDPAPTPVGVATTASPTTTSTATGIEVLPTSVVQTTTTADPGKGTTTTTATTATTAPTEVAGVVLARTGAESRIVLLLAGFLLVVGGALLYSSPSRTER